MEEFVTFKLLCKLRERGYNNNNPRFEGHIYDVLRWLRKEKKIVISILPSSFNNTTSLSNYYYVVYNIKEYFWDKYEYQQSFETYEECELEAIEYVLDNLI